MTDRLTGIEARLDAITPGPWFANRYYVGAGEDPTDPDAEIAKASFKPDAEFIAAAPTDMAALLGAVRAVLGVADRLALEAGNAEAAAVAAAEADYGAGLMAAQSEKFAYQQAERLIRAAINAALEGK